MELEEEEEAAMMLSHWKINPEGQGFLSILFHTESIVSRTLPGTWQCFNKYLQNKSKLMNKYTLR